MGTLTPTGPPTPVPSTHTYPKVIQVMCLGFFKQRMRIPTGSRKLTHQVKKFFKKIKHHFGRIFTLNNSIYMLYIVSIKYTIYNLLTFNCPASSSSHGITCSQKWVKSVSLPVRLCHPLTKALGEQNKIFRTLSTILLISAHPWSQMLGNGIGAKAAM